jgi:hypothetical protein
MTTTQAINKFSSLSPEEKIDFLIRLSQELTIVARDSYEAGGTGLTNPARVRLLNEVQHRIAGCLQALVKDSPKRYPDDVLVKIILEHPEDVELQQQLHVAFGRLSGAITAAA